MRESEERFRSIFKSSPDAICVIDERGRYLMVNDAMCRLTGCSRQELLGEHYSAFMDRATHEMMEGFWEKRKQGESAPERYEFKLIRRDGEARTVENLPTVIQQPDGSALTVAILRDVTEYRRMQDLLQGMRSRLLNLQEKERSSIARALHDTLGQNVSILDFNLTTIEEILKEQDLRQIKAPVANMRSVIRETADKLRDLAGGLHPREVQELGLTEAVRSFVERFKKRTRIRVKSLIQVDDLRIKESVAVNLYRIIQEAFTNIVKHSQSRSVAFHMALEDAHLTVSVRDNGIGFNPEEMAAREVHRRGMGLFIIQERAKAIHGRLQVCSEPHRGTEIRIAVPLARAQRST